jgi:hypothetical protein
VDLPGKNNTGLASANVADTDADVAIQVYECSGTTSIGKSHGPIQLAAAGCIPGFADQFISGLPAGFTGVLDIDSASPFAALTLRAFYNEREDFLMTTFPAAGWLASSSTT